MKAVNNFLYREMHFPNYFGLTRVNLKFSKMRPNISSGLFFFFLYKYMNDAQRT